MTRLAPKWAVISAGKPEEGTNRNYCHPRLAAVEHVVAQLPRQTTRALRVFGGHSCRASSPGDWVDIEASDHLLATPRDGDVVLRTTGGGTFVRVP